MVERRGFDVMLLTDTKIQLEEYFKNCLGYDVKCSSVQSSSARGSQGSIGMVTKERPVRWGIGSMCYNRPNVIICEIVTGLTLTPLVGVYLPQSMIEHLSDLEDALQHFRYYIVLGYLNVDLNEARSPQSQ